jgi:hypothetical protein
MSHLLIFVFFVFICVFFQALVIYIISLFCKSDSVVLQVVTSSMHFEEAYIFLFLLIQYS